MLNMIVIQGRLTRDPELRRTGSGIAVTSFNVAVERDYSNKDTGEFVGKWFDKGAMFVVAGRLQTRSYNDKDGVKRCVTEVVAENVYFGESKKDRETREATSNGGNMYSVPNYGGYYPGPYVTPSGSDFAMLDDDDDGAVLPF